MTLPPDKRAELQRFLDQIARDHLEEQLAMPSAPCEQPAACRPSARCPICERAEGAFREAWAERNDCWDELTDEVRETWRRRIRLQDAEWRPSRVMGRQP